MAIDLLRRGKQHQYTVWIDLECLFDVPHGPRDSAYNVESSVLSMMRNHPIPDICHGLADERFWCA